MFFGVSLARCDDVGELERASLRSIAEGEGVDRLAANKP